MTTAQFQTIASVLKVALAFVNAFAALLAAYPGPELSPLARLMAAAVVAGCGAALLMVNPPGGGGVSDTTIKRMVTEAEGRMRKQSAADPLPPTPRYPKKVTESNQP